MGFSVHWIWFTALSCLLCMGGEVWCDCTEENMEIEGGNYTLTKNLSVGSMLVYHCPEGYYPYPALIRLCQLDSSWRPAPKRFRKQRCKMVECPDPNVLENGNVSPPQERYFVGNETTYECYSGYKLRGSFRRVCLSNTKWSGSTPICSRDAGDNCADPGIPPGALRTGNVFDVGDKVKYSCNGNLFLVGSSERVCLESGQWTGQEPACYYTHTYDTSQEVSEAFGSAIKGSLTTYEPTVDTQEGRKIRISKTGTLNIYIAVDISESIQEEYIQNATNVTKSLISKISSFSVTPNYEVLLFSSQVFRLSRISDFMDGRETLSTLMTKLDNFTETIKDRDTAGTNLNEVFKTFLEEMALVKQRVKDEGFKEHRHVLIVFTDGGYNMGGSPEPTVRKIKNMVYMNHIEGIQSREDYLDIYIFAIGDEILDDELKPLATGTGGRHYFRMQNDLINLKEAFDEIIDADEVLGMCGLYNSTTVGSDKDQRKRFPWVVFITTKNEGTFTNCLGSLVTKEFVLTAAHCFDFGDREEHIKVEIGDQARRVKKIRLHPKFNITAKKDEGVREFYDYDVALLQLEEYVEFSYYIRPVCIPCTQETSDALQLVGASTCKDQEDLLFKNHIEELYFLTKSRSLVKEKTVRAKIGDNRGECISHAIEAPGIKTKNPEVAVTDNFLCTGGLAPQVDHIACTGDSGGAVVKDYFVYRTIQVAVVSWGTKNLCKSGSQTKSDATSRDFHINLFRVVPFLKSVLGDDTQDEYAPLKFLNS
ncbi:complement factor B-like [Thunnus albacares]|uniref:complement factor B-like n=1 Tax=Thunnus albacares TaxID=8236 RepID=UPI001CF632F8|nr:complement factor B-like [Thunnus albacares]